MKKITAVAIAVLFTIAPAHAAGEVAFDWSLITLGFGQYDANLMLCDRRPALDERRRIIEILKRIPGFDTQAADGRLTRMAELTYSEIEIQGCNRKKLAAFRHSLDVEMDNLQQDIDHRSSDSKQSTAPGSRQGNSSP